MKDMTWKTLSSEYLFRKKWLTARCDKAQLPDGRIVNEYYVLEYPTWINVIAIDTDGKMVLVRQYRHGLGSTNFEIVGGVVEENEEPIVAAQRELLEETGYQGGTWSLLMTISPNASTVNNLTHCFIADGVTRTSDQNLDDNEDIEVYTFTKEEVREKLINGEFMQALMVAPLWRYFYLNDR